MSRPAFPKKAAPSSPAHAPRLRRIRLLVHLVSTPPPDFGHMMPLREDVSRGIMAGFYPDGGDLAATRLASNIMETDKS